MLARTHYPIYEPPANLVSVLGQHLLDSLPALLGVPCTNGHLLRKQVVDLHSFVSSYEIIRKLPLLLSGLGITLISMLIVQEESRFCHFA